MEVGFLHPGLMGESLAANCTATNLWVSEGRSSATRARAEQHGLVEVRSLGELCGRADVIVAICPPAVALEVADSVAACGYDRLYVDANAISPDTQRQIAQRFEHVVDGSVIGPPAHKPGTTRLYLSGDRAAEVALLFGGGVVDARVIGVEIGAASALKVAYASWTKIGSALQLAVRAFAAHEGVEQVLVDEWNLSQPGLVERSERAAAGAGPKAWRFVGEMQQIAESFAGAELPSGFADAAAEIYGRLVDLKGTTTSGIDDVVGLINRP